MSRTQWTKIATPRFDGKFCQEECGWFVWVHNPDGPDEIPFCSFFKTETDWCHEALAPLRIKQCVTKAPATGMKPYGSAGGPE